MRRLILSTLTATLLSSALLAGPAVASTATQYIGNYRGQDAKGLRTITFSFGNREIRDFTVNHQHVLLHRGHVSNGVFKTSQNGIDFVGRWEDDYRVVGTYSFHSHGHKTTVHWRANAISS